MADSHAQVQALAMLVADLESSESMPAVEIEARQSRQLGALVAHHARHTPSFAARLKRAGLRAAGLASTSSLISLPPLTRRDIQQLGSSFYCKRVPADQQPVGETTTSGSTGEPVTIRKSAACRLHWAAQTTRDHRWNHRDVTGRLTSIRPTITEYGELPNWGFPMAALRRTGPAQGMPTGMDVAAHLQHIERFQPQTLLLFPSVLAAFVGEWQRGNSFPRSIRHLKTIGETVSDALRESVRQVCALPIEDSYTSQEGGIIAIQCPGGPYHVMAESVFVEVLDAEGNRCEPGQLGRLAITDLHNLASPLIRYDIGDYAVAGIPCACGRTLPTIARIAGRERNLVIKPDGTRNWPTVGFHDFHTVAPVLQYQLVQHSLTDMELIVFTQSALEPAQEAALARIAQRALDYPFDVRVARAAQALPRSASGKYEDFICKVGR